VLDCVTDCDPGNLAVWAGGQNLMLRAGGRLDHPRLDGAGVGLHGPRYGRFRSLSPDDFVTLADCIETDGLDLSSIDLDSPESGAVAFYLVRAENDCPAGEGGLGFTSTLTPRFGRPCP
jgi:hypothetical protein